MAKDKVSKQETEYRDILKEITAEKVKSLGLDDETLTADSRRLDISKQILATETAQREIQEKINGIDNKSIKLNIEQKELLKQHFTLENKILAATKTKLERDQNIFNFQSKYKDNIIKINDLQAELNKKSDAHKKIAEALLHPIHELAEGIKRVPIIGELLGSSIESAEKKIIDVAHNTIHGKLGKSLQDSIGSKKADLAGKLGDAELKAGDLTEVLGKSSAESEAMAAGAEGAAAGSEGMLAALGPIGLAIAAVAAIFALLVGSALKWDSKVSAAAVAMGTTKAESKELLANMNAIGIPAKEAAKYAGIITDKFGYFNAELSKANADGLETLIDNFKLTDEAAGNLFTTSELQGKSTDKLVEDTAMVVGSLKTQYKTSFSVAQILKDMASVSTTTALNFSKIPGSLALAVTKAKIFGTSLDKMAGTGDKLLDVEQSVGDEMEARVITGMKLNLTRARGLAMEGKYDDLAVELTKNQGITLDKYKDLLPFQRKELAKGLQMSEEDLTNMLLKQKITENLTEDQQKQLMLDLASNKISAEQLATEKGVSVEQVKQLIADEDKRSIKEKQEKIMSVMTEKFEKNLSGIGKLLDGLAKVGERIAKGQSLASALFSSDDPEKTPEEITAQKSRETTAIQNGTIVSQNMSDEMLITGRHRDDFISRPGQAPISFNKDDLIIGGTSLMSGGNTNHGPDPQMAEMIGLLKQLLASIDQPVQMVIGSKTIEELDSQISMRKHYNYSADRSSGRLFG